MIVFIDTNTLGLLCNPNESTEYKKCESWFYSLYSKGTTFLTSDICDYETRRGLISSSLRKNEDCEGLPILDKIRIDGYLRFLPVSIQVLNLAANFWATASFNNKTTSHPKNIDVDIIISAHYKILKDNNPGQRVVVSTTNLKHLSLFCEAANWQDIKL